MKKIILASVVIFGISVSFANTNDSNFLKTVSLKLFTENTLSSAEQVKLLTLSSESPENAKKIKIQKSRRNFSYLKLRKPSPFYKKQMIREVDEPSILIVKRKDKLAREKSLRYRALFSAYGR